MSDKSIKNIEDICVGDKVYNYFYGQSSVKNVFEYEISEKIVELNFENGIKISCTKDHKFLTKNRGWVEAEKLTQQDDIVENKRVSRFLHFKNKFNHNEEEYLKAFSGEFNFKDAVSLIERGLSSKRKYKDHCEKCGMFYTKRISSFNQHVYRLNVCKKCMPFTVMSLEECRKNNSKAQLIAQNKPEQKALNSQNVKKYWNKEGSRETASNTMRKLYIDNPDYIKNVTRGLKNSGEVKTNRFGTVIFNGLLELAYIIGCDKDLSIKQFKNYDLEPVPYKREGELGFRSYFPDFIVDGKIIEIKRNFNELTKESAKIVEYKSLYASKFFGDNYEIVFEKYISNKFLYVSKRKNVHRYNYEIKFYNEIN